MKHRVVPVLIVLILIFVVGAVTAVSLITDYRNGSTEEVDYEDEFGLEEDEYFIVYNYEILVDSTDEGSEVIKGVEEDGTVYIDAETVATNINDSFYWDSNEQVFIYTTATKIMKAVPDEQQYTVDGEAVALDYVPIKTINDTVYVSEEYIELFTQCEITAYTDPNHIVITTEWGDGTSVAVDKDTVVRFTDPCDDTDSIDLQHPVIESVEEGDSLVVVETDEDWTWTKVETEDGLIGWIENRYLGEETAFTTTAPEFEEEEFTYLTEDGLICLAWHQVTNEDSTTVSNLQSVLEDTSDITVIAPTWFCFDGTDGNIQSLANADYVTYAHEQGLKVWAVFQNSAYQGGDMDGTNTDNILSYTSKRETLVSELISYVLEYDIDGINLDFEMITEEGADNYIQFVRELSVACRNNGITLSIDNYVPIYTEHYNRAEQFKFADYLVIMGYDEYGSFSTEAGPVASLEFVQEGIEDTLEIIGGDGSRVINGIPFYTVVWNETTPYEDTVSMSTAKEYLEKYPDTTVIAWNDVLGYYYGYYTSSLNDVTYSMWLEESESIAAKLELMSQYDLAGVAVWKLGQEEAEVWDVISAYMNGETIPTHERLLEEESSESSSESTDSAAESSAE